VNPKKSLWQFVKDGLVGIAVTLILSGVLTPIIIKKMYFVGDIDWFDSVTDLIAEMFFFPHSIISPMPFVILMGFISMGIGGRFLENITSRWSWIKPILIISIVSVLMGIVLIPTLESEWDWKTVPFMGIVAGIGFLIASLAGVIFNPTKRLFRLIIGSIASMVVAYIVAFTIVIFQVAY